MLQLSIPNVLSNLRTRVIEDFHKDVEKFSKVERQYFDPKLTQKERGEKRIKMREMMRDFEKRQRAIRHLEEALFILSNGDFSYYSDFRY